jgi:phosphatidate cytidylyltransferase
MTEKKPASNLQMRLLSAVVAIPAILALLYKGPDLGWLAFIATACAIGAYELFGMTHPEDAISRAVGTVLSVGVLVGLWFSGRDPRFLVPLVLCLPIASMLITLWRLGPVSTAALRIMAMTFGSLYLGGGMACLALLKRDGGSDGPSFVLLSLMLAWMSDTGGYFAGRFLGRHKLYEAVSPKKTVEGALGGLAGSVGGALLGSFLYLRSLPVPHAIALGLLGGALGQLGDLGESLVKRSVGVKDSGGVVPGHGGILDRVDALLVTATLCFLYVLFVR